MLAQTQARTVGDGAWATPRQPREAGPLCLLQMNGQLGQLGKKRATRRQRRASRLSHRRAFALKGRHNAVQNADELAEERLEHITREEVMLHVCCPVALGDVRRHR